MTGDKLTENLHAKINEVSEINQEIKRLRAALDARATGLAHAIGGRDALAALFLPDDKTLTEAWVEDLLGLRTGGDERQVSRNGVPSYPLN